MAVLPKYQLKELFESGDLITQTSLDEFIEAAYNPVFVAGSNVTLTKVSTPSGDTITISSTGGGGGAPIIEGDAISITTVGSDKEISLNLDTSQTNLIINGNNKLTFAGIHIKDEGVDVGTYPTINFIGDDVLAQDSGTPGQVNVFVPSPTFASHFNTTDGTTDGTVSEALNDGTGGYFSRSSVRISSPTTEGSPFKTGGGSNTLWAGTNQDSYPDVLSTRGSVIFETAEQITGFSGSSSGDCTVTVNVYDADGVTVLYTWTTPVIYANGTYELLYDTRVIVFVTNYTTDSSKYKANLKVEVQPKTIFNDNGLDGGRYHVEIIMNTDTATDGGGTYTYTQDDIFFDTDQSDPSINGSASIVESTTPANILTKHLSGIEYYILNSEFEVDVTDIDDLNQNTQGRASSASWNFRLTAPDYGLPTLQLTAWNPSVGTMVGWTNQYDVQDVDYDYDSWAINNTNYRFRASSANGSAQVYDPWDTGNSINTPNSSVLIDTYPTTGNSNTLRERFDDEEFRLTRGASSYTTWDSTISLGTGISNQTGTGTFDDAMVIGSNIVKAAIQSFSDLGDSPTYGTSIADFSPYKPDKNGTNPNYTGYNNTATYHRLFETTTNPTKPITSFELTFTGDFSNVGGDAFNALANNNMRIYIRKAAATSSSNVGHNAVPHSLHGTSYNFANYQDPPTGVDAGDGSAQCRTGSNTGNTIQGTFGGSNALQGFYVEVQLVNSYALFRIDQIVCTLNFSDGTSQTG